MEPRDLMRFTKMTGDVIRAMRECPIPIITAIHGIAAGAGAVIALASDFRVVSTSGKFAFLFTKVGLSGGDMGAAYLLPRVVGLGRATDLLMLGGTIDSATADRYGLASRLVADDEIDAAVTELAADPGRRTHAGDRADQVAADPRARHADCQRDGARCDDPGAADDDARPRRVPRRVQRDVARRAGKAAEPAGSPAAMGGAAPAVADQLEPRLRPVGAARLRLARAGLPRLAATSRPARVVLLGRGVQRPVRVVEVRPAERAQVGPPGQQDRVHVVVGRDGADRDRSATPASLRIRSANGVW